MTTIYVQFADSRQSKIAAVFSCSQDPDTYPDQGEVSSSDARYSAYFAALPVSAQMYLAPPG
ncbi:hypothetical protein WI92_30975 [Burkholderia vietnamiensis]|nr:hypothetical protein WI92_30975 [Burkholderia vietnamiensis]